MASAVCLHSVSSHALKKLSDVMTVLNEWGLEFEEGRGRGVFRDNGL